MMILHGFVWGVHKTLKQNQEKTSDFSSLLNEAFINLRQIKLYTNEIKETKKVREANEKRLRAMFRVIRTRASATPLIEVLGGVFTAMVIIYAAGFEETSNSIPQSDQLLWRETS